MDITSFVRVLTHRQIIPTVDELNKAQDALTQAKAFVGVLESLMKEEAWHEDIPCSSTRRGEVALPSIASPDELQRVHSFVLHIVNVLRERANRLKENLANSAFVSAKAISTSDVLPPCPSLLEASTPLAAMDEEDDEHNEDDEDDEDETSPRPITEAGTSTHFTDTHCVPNRLFGNTDVVDAKKHIIPPANSESVALYLASPEIRALMQTLRIRPQEVFKAKGYLIARSEKESKHPVLCNYWKMSYKHRYSAFVRDPRLAKMFHAFGLKRCKFVRGAGIAYDLEGLTAPHDVVANAVGRKQGKEKDVLEFLVKYPFGAKHIISYDDGPWAHRILLAAFRSAVCNTLSFDDMLLCRRDCHMMPRPVATRASVLHEPGATGIFIAHNEWYRAT